MNKLYIGIGMLGILAILMVPMVNAGSVDIWLNNTGEDCGIILEDMKVCRYYAGEGDVKGLTVAARKLKNDSAIAYNRSIEYNLGGYLGMAKSEYEKALLDYHIAGDLWQHYDYKEGNKYTASASKHLNRSIEYLDLYKIQIS